MSMSCVVSRRACARKASQKAAGICGLLCRWEAIMDSRLPSISLVAPLAASSFRAEAAAAASAGRLGCAWPCAVEAMTTRPQSAARSAPPRSGARLRPPPRDDHTYDEHANRNSDHPAEDRTRATGTIGGRQPVSLAFEGAEDRVEDGQTLRSSRAGPGNDHLNRLAPQRHLGGVDGDRRAGPPRVGLDRVDVEALPFHAQQLGLAGQIRWLQMFATQGCVHALNAEHERAV